MNSVALNYVVMRVLYNFLYMKLQKGDKALLRTLVFQIMYLPVMWTFVRRYALARGCACCNTDDDEQCACVCAGQAGLITTRREASKHKDTKTPEYRHCKAMPSRLRIYSDRVLRLSTATQKGAVVTKIRQVSGPGPPPG